MGDEAPAWPREKRPLPPGLIAMAAANPGGSVAEVDGSVVRDPDGYVPVEAVIGYWSPARPGYFMPTPISTSQGES